MLAIFQNRRIVAIFRRLERRGPRLGRRSQLEPPLVSTIRIRMFVKDVDIDRVDKDQGYRRERATAVRGQSIVRAYPVGEAYF